MTEYLSFEDILNTYNLIGKPEGILVVPNLNIQQNSNNEYVVTYSFFRTSEDITNAEYYNFLGSPSENIVLQDDYREDIESTIQSILNPTDLYSVLFSDVLKFKFQENLINTGDITFGQLDGNNTALFSTKNVAAVSLQFNSFVTDSDKQHGDIFINLDHDVTEGTTIFGYNVWEESGSVESGTRGYKVLLEEISHSLGIDIIGTDDNAKNDDLDNHKFTITSRTVHPDMAYDTTIVLGLSPSQEVINDSGNPFPTGLQLFDIASLQEIYGRNYTTRSLGTIYSKLGAFQSDLSDGAFVYTIWDGGSTDTIFAADYTDAVQIDLRQGHFSSIGKDGDDNAVVFDSGFYDAGNVAIAYYTVIENAVGTNDADNGDILIGNAWNNILRGLDGDDSLYGDGFVYDGVHGPALWEEESGGPEAASDGSGNDTLVGGAGNDLLHGGSGSDTADYSGDPSGVNVFMLLGVNGSVIDGFGDTDTLFSIENLVLTGFDDTVTLGVPVGRTIDGRGGEDHVAYQIQGGAVQDFRDADGGIGKVWDSLGLNFDILDDFESVQILASEGVQDTLPDHTRSLDKADSDIGFGNDYSGSSSGAFFDFGNRHDLLPNGQPSSTGDTVFLNNGSKHVGAVSSEMRGTQFSDEIILFGRSMTFDPGRGNDTVTIIPFGLHERFQTIRYSGGDDTYNIANTLHQIRLADTITFSDVNVSSFSASPNKIDAVLTIKNHGSITIHYDDITPYGFNIVLEAGGLITMDDGFGTPNHEGTVTLFPSDNVATVHEGTWGDDSWTSRRGYNETYYAKDGNDVLNANNGDNSLFGGGGNDTLISGPGSDQLSGDQGNDLFWVNEQGSGDNVYDGGTGNDTALFSRNFDNYILSVDGPSGTISLTEDFGNGGHHDLRGIDTIRFADGVYESNSNTHTSVTLLRQTVDDSFMVSSASGELQVLNVLANDANILKITGVQSGQSGVVKLSDDGQSVIYEGTPGFDGSDSFSYLVVRLDGVSETAQVSLDVLDGLVLVGTEGDDTLAGLQGRDVIDGLGGNDTLISGGGADQLTGGDGFDKYILEPGSHDVVINDSTSLNRIYLNGFGFTPDDISTLSEGGPTFILDPGDFSVIAEISGGSNFGALVLDSTTTILFDDLNVFPLEAIVVSEGDDNISVFKSTPLDLLGGNDIFEGSFEADLAEGGAGLDFLIGNGGDDVLYGGSDGDFLIGGAGSDFLDGGEGNDEVNGNGGDDTLYGGADDDFLDGGEGSDFVDGGEGFDQISFGFIFNSIHVDLSQQIVFDDGTGSQDTLQSIEGARGSEGDDTLIGSSEANILVGVSGNDTLTGGGGNDDLYGGEGNDTYVFGPGDGFDRILEFSGTDTLQVTGGLTLADLTFTQVGDDLVIDIASGVTIRNQFSGDPSGVVEFVSFDDGLVVELPSPFMQTNDPPMAEADEFATDEDAPLAGNVLTNDSDPDGDTLRVEPATLTTGGGASVELLEDGSFTYTPAENFHGSDSFDYTLLDPSDESDTGAVTITVNAVNDGPSAFDDDFVIDEDAVLFGDVFSNNGNGVDTDIDGDALTVQANTFVTSAGATVVLNADGTFEYTPEVNFNGIDSFEYTLLDGQGGSGTATVTIDVLPVNDAPEAQDDSFTSMFADPVHGNVLGNDTDVDGDLLSVQEGVLPTAQGGTVTLMANGDFTYEPASMFSGQDSFEYTLLDNQGGSDTAIVTITIEIAEDAIIGTEGRNFLVGTKGNDTILGLGGRDILIGRNGNDIILGGDGRDFILGGNGNDVLSGGEGRDYLSGGRGDDVLEGGKGRDYLRGGLGADTYILSELDEGVDTVRDFRPEQGDVLALERIFEGRFDNQEDEIVDFVKITQDASNPRKSVLSVDADGGGDSFQDLAVLQGATNLDVEALYANAQVLMG